MYAHFGLICQLSTQPPVGAGTKRVLHLCPHWFEQGDG